MRNELVPPTFNQYRGENKFTFRDVVYENKKLLGVGTTASVYCFVTANSTTSLQSVAVKMEHTLKRRSANLFEEGMSFFYDAYWNERIHGLGVLSGDPKKITQPHYLLIPYFEGVLAKNISLPTARELVEWFILVAHFIHEKMHVEKRAVHGDIKMDNVIFNPSKKKAYVIDFGLTERIGVKIGPYTVPEKADPVLGMKKWSPAEFCPQTPPELFGKVGLPAEPSQDAYGLGLFLLALSGRVNHISDEQLKKISCVIHGLRAIRPEERSAIPAAIFKLHADFIVTVSRPIENKLELFRRCRTTANHRVNVGLTSESLSLPLLTKAMAVKQLELADYRTHLIDDNAVNTMLTPGAPAATAAASSEKKNGTEKEQQAKRTLGDASENGRIATEALGFFFALHAKSKQEGPPAGPAQVPDHHL